jgi:hypothetical protein
MTDSPRKSLALYLGIALVAAGVVLSATTLERTIFPEGTIVGTSRRATALWIFRMLLIGLGAYHLIRRPRVTIIHLSAFALMGGVTAALGALFLQFLYVPPPIVCGWRSFAPAAEQNELGFRGRVLKYSKDDYVIVLLGDSNVEAMALAFDSMPERFLESGLNSLGKKVKVFSVGTGGYGQDQELLALEEYFRKYRADLVVLWRTPGNDVWNNVFNTHMANRNPKPTFWLDAGSLRGPSETLGQPLADSRIVVFAMWQRIFSLPRRDKTWEDRLPKPYAPLDHYDGPVNMGWQERWDVNRGRMRDENLATEKSHMAVMLAPRSKRMEYGLDLTRALTRRIEQAVAAQNGKLVLFDVDTHSFASDEDEIFALNGKYYRFSKRQFEVNWSDVSRGFDTEVIPVTVNDWRVGPEDGHLNRQATDQVMRDLARRLQNRIPDKSH